MGDSFVMSLDAKEGLQVPEAVECSHVVDEALLYLAPSMIISINNLMKNRELHRLKDEVLGVSKKLAKC